MRINHLSVFLLIARRELCCVSGVLVAVHVLDQYLCVWARSWPPGNSGDIYILLSKPQDSNGALPVLADQPPLITTDETLAEERIPHLIGELDFLVAVAAAAAAAVI